VDNLFISWLFLCYMKKMLICFLLGQFVLNLLIYGQRIYNNPDSLKSFIVQPSEKPALPTTLPFQHIILVDSRLDTSKIGYVRTGHTFKKLKTETAFAPALQTALSKKYQNYFSTSLALVIVVKKFWLQDASLAEQKNFKMSKATEASIEYANCNAAFDVYVQSGEDFIPLFKCDTTFNEKQLLRKYADELIMRPFDAIIAKIAKMNFSKILQARIKLAWTDIELYNNQRLRFPRFTPVVAEKGIYKTFQDFLQNKPDHADFSIEYGRKTDEVFITENGKPVLLTAFWGLCDGEKNYIKIGFNLFELLKQHNTYDLWGSKLTIDKSARYTPSSGDTPTLALIGSVLINSNKVENNYKPLQLDMETGKVY
jgi:hypothetical protein